MPVCPNGHNQRLGLKCSTCGADLSYKAYIAELRNLPKLKPEYGRFAIVTVGYPRLSLSSAQYVGEISAGVTERKTASNFQVGSLRGGSWLDFQKTYTNDLQRWMRLVGVDKATDRLLVVNTTNPLSVLAIAALPRLEHTAVVALIADQDSTPVEQNTSYVALSLALKRGLPVVAVSEGFEKEMIFFTEDRGFATSAYAMSRLLEPLLGATDDLMDLLERDVKLGVRMHCLSAIIAGSRSVYGIATNAFMAQNYNLSIGSVPGEYQTVHSLAFTTRENESEFEKSFAVFRNRKFKAALNSEFRFRETSSPLYDLVTIYGLKSESVLASLADGYNAIVGSQPELSADGVR